MITKSEHGEVLEGLLRGDIERRVAIKRLDRDADPELADAFADEARLIAQLTHGSIVSLVDYGVIEGRPTLVLEYVDGMDLVELRRRAREQSRPVPVGLSLHIAAEIARALEYAHSARDVHGAKLGVVHRDVTPRNVLVSREGQVKLTDFGIALQHRRAAKTRVGTAKGTLDYMAPEQRHGGQADERTDVFAAGCVLHFLLTGRSPIEDTPIAAPIRPRISDELPPDLAAVIERATRLEASERYSSAGAMAKEAWKLAVRHLEDEGASLLRKFLDDLDHAPTSAPLQDELLGRLGMSAAPAEEGARPKTAVYAPDADEADFAELETARQLIAPAIPADDGEETRVVDELGDELTDRSAKEPSFVSLVPTEERTAEIEGERESVGESESESELDLTGTWMSSWVLATTRIRQRLPEPVRGIPWTWSVFALAFIGAVGVGIFWGGPRATSNAKERPATPRVMPQPLARAAVEEPTEPEVDEPPATTTQTPDVSAREVVSDVKKPHRAGRKPRLGRKRPSAPARPPSTPSPESAPVSADQLEREVNRRASALGLSRTDLSQLPGLTQSAQKFERLLKEGRGTALEDAQRQLLDHLGEVTVPSALLNRNLRKTQTLLEGRSGNLSDQDLSALESQYLDLRSRLAPGVEGAASRALAKEVEALRRRILSSKK